MSGSKTAILRVLQSSPNMRP